MNTNIKRNKHPILLGLPLLIAMSYSSSAAAELCQEVQCTLIGTVGDDQLVGTSGDDVICGLDGDDLIVGLGGDDLMCAGPGNDIVFGGEGNNIVEGDQGDDSIYSSSETDIIFDTQGENFIRIWNVETKVLDQNYHEDRTFSINQNMVVPPSDIDRNPPYDENIARFTTENNTVYGPDGAAFDVRGVNIFPWNVSERDVDGITGCWGFNTVRLHSWILAKKNHQWKDHIVYVDEPLVFDPNQSDYRTYDIAPLIDAYTSQGVVVIVDIHELIGKYFDGTDLMDYLAFIEDLAMRYRNNPYVWIDLRNEPGNWDGQVGDFDDWRNQMILALDTVRAVAPDMMLLIAGTAWGQDSGPSWGHAKVKAHKSALLANADIFQIYENVIAKFHVYDQWTFGEVRLRDYIDQLQSSSDAPVMVGEYGSWNNRSTLEASEYLHNIIKQPEYQHVGRSAWTWAASDPNDLVTEKDGSGYHIDNCEVPTNLTPLGQLVWNDNLANR